MNIYEKAKALAKKHHAGQMYGTHEYAYHLRRVAIRWADFAKALDSTELEWYKGMATCWLHDILEDCPSVTIELLEEEGFPVEVINAIVLLTKEEGYSYNEYLRNITKDDLAFSVKVADTFSNLQESLKTGEVKRIRKYSIQLDRLYKFRGEML